MLMTMRHTALALKLKTHNLQPPMLSSLAHRGDIKYLFGPVCGGRAKDLGLGFGFRFQGFVIGLILFRVALLP